MSIISKSVLQLTRQVIQEDDKDEFFDLLNQARHGIHWELESESYDFINYSYKIVLRYVPERKEWAVYEIYAKTGEPVFVPTWCNYFEKYDVAVSMFN